MSRALAVIAILAVVGFFVFYTQSPDIVQAAAKQVFQPEWVSKQFSLGETISILERPQFFPEIVDDIGSAIGFNIFTADELPPEYRDLAAEQQALENPPEDTVTISGNLEKEQLVATTDKHEKGDGKEAKLVNTGIVASVFTAGERVPVVGKINVPNLPPPYFYSITVYCCGQDKPMVNKGHISTDGQGNFLYKIITTERTFPLGIYDVIVSTLSADIRTNIDYKWQFELR